MPVRVKGGGIDNMDFKPEICIGRSYGGGSWAHHGSCLLL